MLNLYFLIMKAVLIIWPSAEKTLRKVDMLHPFGPSAVFVEIVSIA